MSLMDWEVPINTHKIIFLYIKNSPINFQCCLSNASKWTGRSTNTTNAAVYLELMFELRNASARQYLFSSMDTIITVWICHGPCANICLYQKACYCFSKLFVPPSSAEGRLLFHSSTEQTVSSEQLRQQGNHFHFTSLECHLIVFSESASFWEAM